MANFLYYPAKNRFLTWQASTDPIDLLDDTISVCIVDAAYGPDPNDQDFSIIQLHVVGTPVNLAGRTVVDGVFDANDVTFTAVSGATVTSLVIYQNTGTPSSSNLIAFIDVVASGLPLTPNGGNITVQWSPSGIFSL